MGDVLKAKVQLMEILGNLGAEYAAAAAIYEEEAILDRVMRKTWSEGSERGQRINRMYSLLLATGTDEEGVVEMIRALRQTR